MKRYLLFVGRHYYPVGGMEDFKEDFDSLGEVTDIDNVTKTFDEYDNEQDHWAHIYDSEERKIILVFTGDLDEPWEKET
jgi:hypothetical protein